MLEVEQYIGPKFQIQVSGPFSCEDKAECCGPITSCVLGDDRWFWIIFGSNDGPVHAYDEQTNKTYNMNPHRLVHQYNTGRCGWAKTQDQAMDKALIEWFSGDFASKNLVDRIKKETVKDGH